MRRDTLRGLTVWMAVGYVAVLLYAGAMFTWLAARDRWAAAVGLLLALSGAQLAMLHTLPLLAGAAVALLGAACLAREAAAVVAARATPRPAFAPARIERCDTGR